MGVERRQFIGYETSSECDNFAGKAREISINLQTKAVRVHDGSKMGGYEQARADLTNVSKSDMDTAIKPSLDTLVPAIATATVQPEIQRIDEALSLADTKITQNENNITSLRNAKADKSNTLAGYGITNAYTKDEANSLMSSKTETDRLLDLRVPKTMIEQDLTSSSEKIPSSKAVMDEIDARVSGANTDLSNLSAVGEKKFTDRKLKGIEGCRSIAVNGNTTISLQATDEILDIPVSANSTITFDLSSVAMPLLSFYTVQIKLRPSGNLTIGLNVAGLLDGAPVAWVNGNVADLTDGSPHWIVLRTYENKGYALWSDAGREG